IYTISGSLNPLWQIDALEGEAGSNNTPPGIRFAESGPEARGPAGMTAGPITTTLNAPLTVTIWARDDGKGTASIASSGRGASPSVSLAYFKHQGPGDVTFTAAAARVPAAG